MTTVAQPTSQYAKTVDRAFELFQIIVNTNSHELKEARRRRDLFDRAFEALNEVEDVFCSGSLARKTHKDPIHDVDSVVIFKPGSHRGWGIDGNGSAVRALEYTNSLVAARVPEVVSCSWHNHAVKCDFSQLREHDFTVDVMPALSLGNGTEQLLVPVATEDRWETVDPRYFISETAKRQAAWSEYVPTLRVIKFWNSHRKDMNPALNAKSLLVEVAAFHELQPAAVPRSLQTFFTRAEQRVRREVLQDPAGLCGPIQADVNLRVLLGELALARDVATRANALQSRGNEDGTIEAWGSLLGGAFPKPQPKPGIVTPAAGGAVAAAIPAQSPTAAPRQLRDHPQG